MLLPSLNHSRWFVPLLLATFLSASIAPAESFGSDSSDTLSISVTSLNARSGPGQQYAIVGTVKQGEQYTILREQDQWYEIALPKGKGWIASWMVSVPGKQDKPADSTVQNESQADTAIKINIPTANIRSGAGTSFRILQTAHKGDTFPLVQKQGDWLQIRLADGRTGYIASWITQSEELKNRKEASADVLQGKTFVVDAGHGGEDSGAVGAHQGSLEKVVNLQVALILKDKLEAAGAKIVLTRQDDRRVSLKERVDIAADSKADAFISIHHNTNENALANGEITYYYRQGEDRDLAYAIQKQLVKRTGLADLRPRFGDYFVLRENPRLAVLCELGFLTNYQEDVIINTKQFQEHAADGIFQGLVDFYSQQMKKDQI